jgi:hypothetical protein
MSILTDEVKRIAESLDANYLRAVSLEDFNQAIRSYDLADPLVSLINIPEIDNQSFEAHTSLISNVSLQILFVKKNFDPDDSGDTVQGILDDMEALANEFFDLIRKSTVIAKAVKPEGFSLSGGDQIQFSDERVSGWLMALTVPMDRKDSSCV